MIASSRVFGGKKYDFYQYAKSLEGACGVASMYRLRRRGMARVTPIKDKTSYEYRAGHRYVIWVRD